MRKVFFVFVLVTMVVAFASAQDETDDDLQEFQDLIEEFKRARGRGRSRVNITTILFFLDNIVISLSL